MSEKIADWLIRQKAISADERELYIYAVHCLFSLLYPIVFASVVGAIFGMVMETIVMIIPFILVRKFAGGYHADSFGKCLIISSMVIIVTIQIAMVVDNSYILNAIYVAGSMLLILFSPIDSENKRLDIDDKKFCKMITVFIVLILFIIVEIFWLKGYRYYIKFIELGVVLAELLQIVAIIINLLNSIRNCREE